MDEQHGDHVIPEINTVFVVVSDGTFDGGCHIHKVYSSKADADACAAMMSEPFVEYSVQEWPVDPAPEKYEGKVWHCHYRRHDDHYATTEVDYSGVRLRDAELLTDDGNYITMWGMDRGAVTRGVYERAQRLKSA